MPLPDQVLGKQLICFMHAIPHLWGWDGLLELHQTQQVHVEYRGPEADMVTFMLEVVEHDFGDEGEYLQAFVHACDMRSGKVLGSTNIPLCGCVLLFRDGRVDFSGVGNGAADEATQNLFRPMD